MIKQFSQAESDLNAQYAWRRIRRAAAARSLNRSTR